MILGIWHNYGLFLGLPLPIWFLSDLYIPGSMSVTTGDELGVTSTCVSQ
jgi:hypothetical protein